MPGVDRLVGLKLPAVNVPITFKLVVVAFVPVALTKVKFWRVEDPVATRLGVVKRPAESMVVVAVPPA